MQNKNGYFFWTEYKCASELNVEFDDTDSSTVTEDVDTPFVTPKNERK